MNRNKGYGRKKNLKILIFFFEKFGGKGNCPIFALTKTKEDL
jgi:hypothetical protein